MALKQFDKMDNENQNLKVEFKKFYDTIIWINSINSHRTEGWEIKYNKKGISKHY